ncbi:hypothetical protein [Paraburkholderia caballeronis]|uniref:hypothetical protein n=1 Tax=Paraburkholderia caballeronis TaxID=416943 RepID=UPI001FB8CEAE|nr:hypothetical protein [Paraburkholderia caballeronis]
MASDTAGPPADSVCAKAGTLAATPSAPAQTAARAVIRNRATMRARGRIGNKREIVNVVGRLRNMGEILTPRELSTRPFMAKCPAPEACRRPPPRGFRTETDHCRNIPTP